MMIPSQLHETETEEFQRVVVAQNKYILSKMEPEDRAAFLTSVIFDEYVPIMARIKANELLGRMYGDYLQKVIIKEQQTDMPTIQFNLDDDD